MNKPTIEIKKTSQRGQSILVVNTENDCKFMPAVSQQLPTNIALWIKDAIEKSDKTPDDFTDTH